MSKFNRSHPFYLAVPSGIGIRAKGPALLFVSMDNPRSSGLHFAAQLIRAVKSFPKVQIIIGDEIQRWNLAEQSGSENVDDFVEAALQKGEEWWLEKGGEAAFLSLLDIDKRYRPFLFAEREGKGPVVYNNPSYKAGAFYPAFENEGVEERINLINQYLEEEKDQLGCEVNVIRWAKWRNNENMTPEIFQNAYESIFGNSDKIPDKKVRAAFKNTLLDTKRLPSSDQFLKEESILIHYQTLCLQEQAQSIEKQSWQYLLYPGKEPPALKATKEFFLENNESFKKINKKTLPRWTEVGFRSFNNPDNIVFEDETSKQEMETHLVKKRDISPRNNAKIFDIQPESSVDSNFCLFVGSRKVIERVFDVIQNTSSTKQRPQILNNNQKAEVEGKCPESYTEISEKFWTPRGKENDKEPNFKDTSSHTRNHALEEQIGTTNQIENLNKTNKGNKTHTNRKKEKAASASVPSSIRRDFFAQKKEEATERRLARSSSVNFDFGVVQEEIEFILQNEEKFSNLPSLILGTIKIAIAVTYPQFKLEEYSSLTQTANLVFSQIEFSLLNPEMFNNNLETLLNFIELQLKILVKKIEEESLFTSETDNELGTDLSKFPDSNYNFNNSKSSSASDSVNTQAVSVNSFNY